MNGTESVSQLLARGAAALQGSESARADAQILLAFALGWDRARLIARGDAVPAREKTERFAVMCERRAAGVPIAYLTGYAGFVGREFEVNESVLIPRPESEHLVEDALAYLRAKAATGDGAEPRVFEAGVGSGAIACTIAAEVARCRVDGSEIDEAAIAVARRNAARFNVAERCRFEREDLRWAGAGGYDVVIANLPYIPTADLPQPPDPVSYEPRIALDGGRDGLALYRRFLAAVPGMLRRRALVLLEAAPASLGGLRELTASALPGCAPEVRRDYAGLDRYVYARQGDAYPGERMTTTRSRGIP